jgi:hypothetical protein
VDLDKGQLFREGEEIYLSALEYRLLVIFIQNRGILLSRNKLLDDIWDIAGDYSQCEPKNWGLLSKSLLKYCESLNLTFLKPPRKTRWVLILPSLQSIFVTIK